MARSARKELFGFYAYVDLGTGVLLSSTLFAEVVEPANCQREKTADGTFDVVDAKLGNCLFSLGATPRQLAGFVDRLPADRPTWACEPSGGLGGAVSIARV